MPLKTVAEYIAYAKANPGKLNFGSGGVGTSPHMSGELLKSMTGIDIVHVPYRGTAPALIDLLGGQVHPYSTTFRARSDTSSPASCARSASTDAKRMACAARRAGDRRDRAGLRGERLFTASRCRRARRPRSSPSSMPAVNTVLKDPKLQARIHDLGADADADEPGGFGKLVQSQTDKWAKVIKSAGMPKIQ